MSGPPQRAWKLLGDPNKNEMSTKEETSKKARSSAGTDGQGESPPPASNKRGQEAFGSTLWENMEDEIHETDQASKEGEQGNSLRGAEEKEKETNNQEQDENKTKQRRPENTPNPIRVTEDTHEQTNRRREDSERKKREREKREEKRMKREKAIKEQRRRLDEFNNLFRGQDKWNKYLDLTTHDKPLSALELDDYLLGVFASQEMSFKNKQKDKNSWIIRTTCKEQSEKFLKIKEINGTQVSVTAHAEMNSVYGTMLLFREDEEDEDRCRRILEKRHENVEEVKLITLPRNNTKIAKIKFKGNELPEKMFMGGRRRDVKPYIPKPNQCHKCSKFGHFKEHCRNEKPACFYCAGHDHEPKWQCGNNEKCINCTGNHHSRSQKCSHYVYNAQVRHLQLRTGMSVRDAKEELRERGILDPFRRNTFATAAKGTSASQRDNSQTSASQSDNSQTLNEEEMELTQAFQTETDTQAGEEEITTTLETKNRFEGMEEESLDEGSSEEATHDTSISDIEEAWNLSGEPKPQRNQNKQGKQNARKQQISKRTRETSPKEEASIKEGASNNSPPTKKLVGIGSYSSSSEEEQDRKKTKETDEKKGWPIPTIVNSKTDQTRRKDPIPNPFRPSTRADGENHPLKPAPTEDLRNDLEGVRQEMSRLYPPTPDEQKHSKTCGCDLCFWKETHKIGKLTENKIQNLISEFIKNRQPVSTKRNTEHTPTCMCITCITRKVNESKEKVIKQLMEKNENISKRDPRVHKEDKESV